LHFLPKDLRQGFAAAKNRRLGGLQQNAGLKKGQRSDQNVAAKAKRGGHKKNTRWSGWRRKKTSKTHQEWGRLKKKVCFGPDV